MFFIKTQVERLKQKSSSNSNRRIQPQIAKPIRPGQHLAVIRPNSSTQATHGSDDPTRQQQGLTSFIESLSMSNAI